MKKFIYWLMGDRAGKVIVGSWNWLWGIPVESGAPTSVSRAHDSLRIMQDSVAKLATAVSAQVNAYKIAKETYQAKVKEKQTLEKEAHLSQQIGKEDEARLAMMKAIQIEQILPQFEAQLRQAEELVKASQEKLNQEQMRLESYKLDLHNIQAMSEVNNALKQIEKVNDQSQIDAARAQFEEVKNAIHQSYLETQALAELSGNPEEKMQNSFAKMEIETEVNQRLKRSKKRSSKSH